MFVKSLECRSDSLRRFVERRLLGVGGWMRETGGKEGREADDGGVGGRVFVSSAHTTGSTTQINWHQS